MNVQNKQPGGLLPPDTLAKRLRWAIIASILLNIIGWRSVAAMAKRPLYVPPRPVEITRVIIDNKGHKTIKVVKKEEIKKKVAAVRKPPPPKLRPVVYHQPPKPVTTPPPPAKHDSPPPQDAYNKFLTDNSKTPTPSPEPDVRSDGNAAPGTNLDHQGDGNGKENVPVVAKQPDPPVVKQPEVVKQPDPPPVVKQPEVVKQPDPPPVIKQPDPPPPPVVHKGPTKEAEPVDQVKPEIPDSLRHGEFKSFVRVKVLIGADGTATTILRTSSGNPEIDQRVLDALKKWKWKPALQNGVAVESTQLFKFEFLVE